MVNKEKVQELLIALGAMTEQWHVAYQSFLKLGYSKEDARLHTQGLMTAILQMNNGKGNSSPEPQEGDA